MLETLSIPASIKQAPSREWKDGEWREVTIPARNEHEGIHAVTIRLRWVCPTCGGPRGEPFKTISWDGSRRLHCDGWKNPCGHRDIYDNAIREARAIGDWSPGWSGRPRCPHGEPWGTTCRQANCIPF